MHCHLEVHTTWGLKMAFLVDNGKGSKQTLIPPPKDLPKWTSVETRGPTSFSHLTRSLRV